MAVVSVKTTLAHQRAQEAAIIRRQSVLELRLTGLSSRQVATQLGLPHVRVYRDLQYALKEAAERGAELAGTYHELELARLDALLVAVHEQLAQAETPGLALQAIDRALRISESRRKLLGLDAPAPVQQVDHAVDMVMRVIYEEAPRVTIEPPAHRALDSPDVQAPPETERILSE